MKITFLKNKKIVIGVIALGSIIASSVSLFSTPQAEQNSVREREYIAKKDNITVGVETSGQINTLPNLHTVAEDTVIDNVFIKLGSEVKKGDKLASISQDNLEALIKSAKDELSDAKAALLQASSDKDVLVKQNGKSKQDGLTNIHQEYDMKLEQLGSDKTRLEQAVENYENKINNLEEEILNLSSKVKTDENKIENFKSKINENNIKIGELNEKLLEVDDGSSERKSLNAKIADIQFEIQESNNLLSEKAALENQNQSTIKGIEAQILELQNEIKELERQLNEVQNEEDKMAISYRIEMLRSEIVDRNAEIRRLSYGDEIVQLKNKISNQEAKLKDAQKELNALSDGSEESKAIRLQITKLQNENTTWQQEIDKLLENVSVAELEKLKTEKASAETTLEKTYTDFSLKLEEIQRTETQYTQALESQGKDNSFGDYKVSEELKAINEKISKANRNVGYAQEKLNKLSELKKNPTLYAQMDGVVTAINYNPGDTVMKDKPVCVIGKLSEITLTVPVSAGDIGNVEIGQKVNIYVDAFAEQKFTGKVTERLLVANDNGDYPVSITMDPTDQMILPGMKAFGTIILKEKQDILVISNKAILLENGEQYVNTKNENGELVKTKIITGFSDGRVSEVISGLSENDVAVVQE